MSEFNFDIKETGVLRSLTFARFPLFKYAKILYWLFFGLFCISLLFIGFSYLGLILESPAIKISVVFLALFLVCFELHLFSELHIKQYKPSGSLSGLLQSTKEFNMAEFLNQHACSIVQEAITICKKSRFSEVTSQALFYALLKNKDCRMLIYRLGIDIKALEKNLKNYLEKSRPGVSASIKPGQPLQSNHKVLFSESFQKTIIQAAAIAVERGGEVIGEKEMLIALATHDEFFKKVLVEYDLKEKDIENITLWLEKIEQTLEKNNRFWTKEHLSKFGSLGRDFASGFTVMLDKFSVDLTKAASKNMFNEIIGHEQEIHELEVVLVSSRHSNALLIADVGVGRKSIIQALAQRCFLKTGLVELYGKKVIELDMISLISQIQNFETLETTLDQIFQEVLRAGNVILVIPELDRFVEQKIQKPGEVDISGILAKYLALPGFQFVGTTSLDALHRKLEQNPSFLEYFRKIKVSEVSEIETIRILQNLALHLEQQYNLLIIYPSIREIIHLTGRYFPSLPFPKKAIDVLDEAVSMVKALKEKVVLPSHIAQIISDKTKIPIGKMEFKEKSVLLNLEPLIHQRIIGQDEAVSEISIAMRRARSGLSSKKRPMGVFLFLGPTGVGKTEMAKALAEIYFNGEDKMIRLDMSEFQAIADIPRLIGQISPVEEQGLLTTPVRENPFSLVLLDEVEKAHPNILNLFLQVFDEGHITDGQGRKVIFTNTIIICTSNAGAEAIFSQVSSGQKIEKDTIFDALFKKGIFKPEFVNRFDAAVLFHPLTKENLLNIAELNLQTLAKNLKEKDIDFVITKPLKEKIVELSYKPEFGARQMRRVIQDNIENVIAQALLSDTLIKGEKFEINPEDFTVIKNN